MLLKRLILIVMPTIVISIDGIGYAMADEAKRDAAPDVGGEGVIIVQEETREIVPEYVPGEVLVKFKEGAEPSYILKEGAEPSYILKEAGVETKEINRIHSIKPAVAKFKKDYKLEEASDGWYPFLGKNYKKVNEIPDEEFKEEGAR